jgi:hypothetical protein
MQRYSITRIVLDPTDSDEAPLRRSMSPDSEKNMPQTWQRTLDDVRDLHNHCLPDF